MWTCVAITTRSLTCMPELYIWKALLLFYKTTLCGKWHDRMNLSSCNNVSLICFRNESWYKKSSFGVVHTPVLVKFFLCFFLTHLWLRNALCLHTSFSWNTNLVTIYYVIKKYYWQVCHCLKCTIYNSNCAPWRTHFWNIDWVTYG